MPARAFVLLLCLPLLTGCFGLIPTPIPASPSQREALQVEGVVERDGERVEFAEVLDVSWTSDQLFIVGEMSIDGTSQTVTRQYPLAGIESVLVRQLDAGKTSGLIGGVLVGTIVTLAVLITGSDPRNN